MVRGEANSKKRKSVVNNNSPNKKIAHKPAIQMKIDQLSILVGSIESEEEVAAFYDYYASLNNSPDGKDKQFAVEAYLNQLGDGAWQDRIWNSVSVYATMGKIPSYFLKSIPQRFHSMLWLEEILGVANTISNLALQNRLDVLAGHDSVKKAMETRGRSRGAEILKAYMAVYKQQAGVREWDHDTLIQFGYHVYQKAHGDDASREIDNGSVRYLSHRPATAVDDQANEFLGPSREQSVKPEEPQGDEMQQEENLYDNDDRARVGRWNSEQESSPSLGRNIESPTPPLEEEITASAATLANCQVTAADATSAANLVRKRYKSLNNQLVKSLAKILDADTERHGDEATMQSTEAKAELCEEFGREKGERVRSMFKELLDQEIRALEALRLAEINHSALLERRASQEVESDDDQWEI